MHEQDQPTVPLRPNTPRELRLLGMFKDMLDEHREDIDVANESLALALWQATRNY